MRKLIVILSLLSLVSCSRENLCCKVTLLLDSEEPIVALTVDNSLPGNYFRNLNTGETYDYPAFVNGRCEVEVLKGVYVLAFDGVAAFSDGSARQVRMAEYASSLKAVSLTADQAEVKLKLLELQ